MGNFIPTGRPRSPSLYEGGGPTSDESNKPTTVTKWTSVDMVDCASVKGDSEPEPELVTPAPVMRRRSKASGRFISSDCTLNSYDERWAYTKRIKTTL